MLDCKSMATPMDTNLKLLSDESSELVDMTHYRQIIGSLMYLTNTRTDICFVVNNLSQYLDKPRRYHQLIDAKHVMRYLKRTIDFGLYYDGSHEYRLYGYIDVDWVGSISDRKSTLGRCFCLGSAMSSWFSKKQSRFLLEQQKHNTQQIALLSCEAIWLRKLISGLLDLKMDTTLILCDNESCDNKEPCVPL